jgi:hypothetical protein
MDWTRECEDFGLKSAACRAPSLGWKSDGPLKKKGISRLSSRNMDIDKPGTMVKIPLVNRHPYAK